MLLPPIVPSYTLLDFPHLPPKLGFLDTFFILQHSFQLHDLYNSFTSYWDSSLLSLPVQGTLQPCAPYLTCLPCKVQITELGVFLQLLWGRGKQTCELGQNNSKLPLAAVQG